MQLLLLLGTRGTFARNSRFDTARRLFRSRVQYGVNQLATSIEARIEVEIWSRRVWFSIVWMDTWNRMLCRSSRFTCSRFFTRISEESRIDIAEASISDDEHSNLKKTILFRHSFHSRTRRKSFTPFLQDVIIRRLLVRHLNYAHREARRC